MYENETRFLERCETLLRQYFPRVLSEVVQKFLKSEKCVACQMETLAGKGKLV